MAKPYTWDEIESFLKTELKKTSHILTFGTIGSKNVLKDIDVIVTKKPSSKSSEYYRELHFIFDMINSYLLDKYNAKLIRFSMFSHENEVLHITNVKKNDLLLHVHTYVSFPQMIKHWTPNLEKGDSVLSILKDNYDCILGHFDDLIETNFQKEHSCEALFLYLNDLDRINSNYPEDFLLKVMNSLFDYILRKRLKLESKNASSVEEVRKIFYETCDILDDGVK